MIQNVIVMEIVKYIKYFILESTIYNNLYFNKVQKFY